VTAKQLVLLPQAEHDIDDIMDHYRREGGAALAVRWSQAVIAALRHIGTHCAGGSLRYADMLGIPGLRHWPVKRFPYLVFYVERSAQVDVWRVLHDHRDIPGWLREEVQ
jgi:toxin ParE1/3/4